VSTANERRALWFLAAVALSGGAVRLLRSRAPELSADAAIARQLARVDSVRGDRNARRQKAPRSRPQARAKEPAGQSIVELETATAPELEALPGIGPALAARIVSHRDSVGRFGSVAAFCEVRGVGPALVARLRPHITIGGAPPDASAACDAPAKAASGRRAKGHSKRG